jgi:hypothetical protein
LDDTLLRLGAIEASELDEARAGFVRLVVAGAFDAMDGEYSFERQPAGTRPPLPGLATAEVILESVRRLGDPDVVRYALGDLDRVLVLSTDPRRLMPNATLRPADAYVMSRVNGALTGREVLGIVPLPREQAMRSLLALLCLGAVEYGASED